MLTEQTPSAAESGTLRPAQPRRAHARALDGLRGLAVLAVLLFHHGVARAGGGFLGVSLFFVLSGFLIGALLKREATSTGGVAIRAFWARRARRLVPAAFLIIAVVAVAARLSLGTYQGVSRAEVVASLGFAEHWFLLGADQSYGQLFSASSPLLHLWSVGVEAQFYLLVAPLVAWCLRPGATGRLRGATPVVALLVATTITHLALGWSGAEDAVYYSTPARMPELLVGVLAAWWWAPPALGGRAAASVAVRRRGILGAAGLAIVAIAVVMVDVDAAIVHRGLLPLVALAGAAAVVASATPGTGLARWLSWAPLAVVGRLSYGIYLLHWPLFLVLTPDRTGVEGGALLAVRLLATFAAAIVSFVAVERPLLSPPPRAAHGARRGGRSTADRVLGLRAGGHRVALATGAVAIASIALLAGPGPISDELVLANQRFDDREPAPQPTTALRSIVVGDSTALMTGLGLDEWGRNTGLLGIDTADIGMGCSLGRTGDRDYQDLVSAVPPECDWSTRWPATLAARPAVEVAIVQFGPLDVTDRRLPGDDRWVHPGDPDYDRYLLDEMLAAIDLLAAEGVGVVWMTSPLIELGRAEQPPPDEPYPTSDPARTARFNELLRQAAQLRPDVVRVVELGSLLAAEPGGELDGSLRPDGIHFSEEGSIEFAARLGPEVLAAAAEVRPASGGG